MASRVWVYVIVSVLLLLGLGGLAYFIYSRSKKDETTSYFYTLYSTNGIFKSTISKNSGVATGTIATRVQWKAWSVAAANRKPIYVAINSVGSSVISQINTSFTPDLTFYVYNTPQPNTKPISVYGDSNNQYIASGTAPFIQIDITTQSLLYTFYTPVE